MLVLISWIVTENYSSIFLCLNITWDMIRSGHIHDPQLSTHLHDHQSSSIVHGCRYITNQGSIPPSAPESSGANR